MKFITDLFKKKKKIGLALGGGAVLGAAHIGVLKAIEEYEIHIDMVSGTSIGAFVGALYSFGKTSEEIKEIALDLKWIDISSIVLSQYGLLSNKNLGELLRKNIGDVNFEDAKIPLSVVAADISTGREIILNSGNVARAVTASACIPGVFIPVEIDDKMLVDGGVVENTPVTPLRGAGANYIIGIDLTSKNLLKKPENIIDVLINSLDITLSRIEQHKKEKADLIISPDLSGFNLIDTDQVPALIEKGYEAARPLLKNLSS